MASTLTNEEKEAYKKLIELGLRLTQGGADSQEVSDTGEQKI